MPSRRTLRRARRENVTRFFRYIVATACSLIAFILIGIGEAAIFGQMLDVPQDTGRLGTAAITVGLLSIPVAAALVTFSYTNRILR